MSQFPSNIDLSTLDGTTGFTISGVAAGDLSGWSVASAGDVNGDGFADLIVGANGADLHGSSSGASYVVFGKAGGFSANIDLSSLDGATGFKLSGAAAYDRSGFSVASAGDVNGDGFADLIVGAYGADPHGSSSGASYVVFGKAGGFSANIDLSSLDGATGFKLSGAAAYDRSGFSVASAGDVNGDGFADLIVGAYGADPHGSSSGASYVVFGKAGGFSANIDLSSLDGTTGFTLSGTAAFDQSGRSVASAGDVNGDGFADLIVGAFGADPHGSFSGASYVVFGKAGGFSANIDLSSLDGTTGFTLSGTAAFDQSGRSVASAGDVNGDGFADLIVGANGADPHGSYSGASYVVFGKAGGFSANIDLSSLDGATGFTLSGVAAYDRSGFSVASAGDVNGDGFADLIVGAYGADPHGSDSGASYVVFGKASGFSANIDLSALDGATGFTLSGVAASDQSGFSVASAGDVNGDGFADLIVGAYVADPHGSSSGASYVVFGVAPDTAVNRTGTAASQTLAGGAYADTLSGLGGNDRLHGNGGNDTLDGGAGIDTAVFSGMRTDYIFVRNTNGTLTVTDLRGGSPDGTDTLTAIEHAQFADGTTNLQYAANIDLSTLDGTTGFTLSGAAAGDNSGFSVASAGDVNGDGFADLIVGANGADPHGSYSGASYVVFGKAGGFSANIDLSALDGATGFKLSGAAAYDRSGFSVASAGDVNGDGFADLIVGANGADPHGSYSGASYVVFGKAGGFSANIDLSSLDGATGFTLSGAATSDFSGRSVASAGDVNGDGFADLIVGAYLADPHGSDSGASYVVFGKASGFSANIDLSALDGATGFKLSGVAAGDVSGSSVASAGDVNGDGFADLIVGAYLADPHGSSSGASYVVFGKAGGFSANIDLSSLDGTTGFTLSGAATSDFSGRSVASAGDVNGDGFADLIVGANGADPHGSSSGTSYVVFGKASGFSANIDLSSLDGTTGFTLSGTAANDLSGLSVASAGDVNGDGFADLIVGAFGADPHGSSSGASYVVFGKAGGFSANIDLSTLNGTTGFKLSGVAAYDDTGISVASAGDVNGDGFADLIVGADRADPHGSSSGASYVVFGVAPDTAVNRTGTAASQTLAGGAYADTLYGLGGNDNLYGNGGSDTAVFTGVRTDYVITHNANGTYTVADSRGGAPDGTDTLHGIELFQFSDGTISAPVASVLGGGGNTVSYTENDSGVQLEGALTVADADSANLVGAVVTISDNFFSGDTLSADVTGTAISASFDGGTGVLTLSGSDTVSNYEAVLRTVTFSSSSDNPDNDGNNPDRTVTWQVDDGVEASNTQSTTVLLDVVNDAPVAAITPASYSATEQTTLNLKNNGLSVSDVDGGAGSMTVTLSVTEGTLTVTAGTSGAAVSGDGTDSVDITGTLAQINALLNTDGTSTVTYIDDTDTPSASATLTLLIHDNGNTGGADLSASDTVTIDITAADDAAVARNDAFSTDVATAIGAGLNLFDANGSGADSDVDGPALSVSAVGGGTVGTGFALASGALLTVNADGTFNYDPTNAAGILALHLAAPGSGASNMSTTDSFAYTLANGNTATVTLTIDGVNNANTIYEGDGGNNVINGDATLGGLYHLDQGGDDTVTGGAGNDGFYFGAELDGNDLINGGGGNNNQIGLEGDYSAGITLSGSEITNIQVIAMLPAFDYTLSTDGTMTLAGQTLDFWSVTMAATNHVNIDAHLEPGNLRFFLGQGNDIAKGGTGTNLFYGEGGSDSLTGNTSVDTFAYLGVSDSTGNGADHISNFAAGTDKFDLPVSVTGIDSAVSGGGGSTVDAAVTGSVGASELLAHHAVLYTAGSGDVGGKTFLVVDANGVDGYQTGQDFVFDMINMTGTLTTADFI